MTRPTKFEQHLKQDLLATEEATSAPEIFRLAQARNHALAQAHKPGARFLWPAFGTSFASALLVVVLFNGQSGSAIGIESKSETIVENSLANESINDEELIYIDDDNIDLYEDLDFYYWLAETDLDGTS